MSWSGKALGGLFGALVGGPVGAGVGAAVGHYLGDAGGQPGDRRARPPLELVRLGWVHHVFSESGPGVELTPVWLARGLCDKDVTVRIDAGEACQTVVVTPEQAVEEIEAPTWFVPYGRLPDRSAGTDGTASTVVLVTLRSVANEDKERFDIPLPGEVRQLGNSGPGRIVMALVGCARAGGRKLSAEDREWIRLRFIDGQPLDAHGLVWLDRWLSELARADSARLDAPKVAERLAPRVDDRAAGQLLMWLMHGARAVWPGPAGEAYIAELAAGLGLSARLDGLWAQVAREPDPVALLKSAAVLGVSAGSTREDARAAYRALVARWHPDRARTPAEVTVYTARTAAINAAWAIFSAV